MDRDPCDQCTLVRSFAAHETMSPSTAAVITAITAITLKRAHIPRRQGRGEAGGRVYYFFYTGLCSPKVSMKRIFTCKNGNVITKSTAYSPHRPFPHSACFDLGFALSAVKSHSSHETSLGQPESTAQVLHGNHLPTIECSSLCSHCGWVPDTPKDVIVLGSRRAKKSRACLIDGRR